MPETDILNPQPGYDPALGDSMNPNYGFGHKRPLSRLTKKAPGGGPYTRETQNIGHQFVLSWIGRTLACARRLKWYYEQYEDGFFTIIDHDGGGRHYVGRFETEPNIVETANKKWDVQQVTFTEIPRVPMVKYPNDWDRDGVTYFVNNDFGDQKVAQNGAWALATHNFGDTALQTLDNPGNAGEWAQYEYRGYGFRLHLLQGPEFGQVQVLLDTVLQQTIDLYAAEDSGPGIVLAMENVPLDFHRVKVIATGNKNAAATGTAVSWYSLEVMK
jgi:hypothetical protein